MTDSPAAQHRRTSRRRFAPVAVVAGVLASAAIAASMTGTLGAFTASIQNTVNNTATGYLTMQEQNAGATVTCNSTDGTGNGINVNSATCSGINKYGGSTILVPGQTSTTTVTITNTGSVAANTFSLTPTACTQNQNPAVATANSGSATDLCSRLSLVLTEKVGAAAATTPVNGVTLTALGTAPIPFTGGLASGATATFTFAVTLASGADNTYQGLQAKQMLTWTFTS